MAIFINPFFILIIFFRDSAFSRHSERSEESIFRPLAFEDEDGCFASLSMTLLCLRA
jgi:hypothetical protein